MLKLLDFWAPWCGPCKMMHPVLEEVKKEFDGKLEVLELNVDEELGSTESEKYGVMSIPTYIVLKDDKEIARKVGFVPKEELVSLFKNEL